MEPTEDGARNKVLGWNTSHGRQPTCPDRRLNAKTAMGSAMIVTNVLLENARGDQGVAEPALPQTRRSLYDVAGHQFW
jgi:hypothetical protein